MTSPSPRQSGVLAHPTCLPGPYGIGDLGSGARRFVDWLQQARQQLWQVLPLNPVAHGNSPYASPSAFAGNTLLLSVEGLIKDGLLELGDVNTMPSFPRGEVDFGAVTDHRRALFDVVFERFRAGRGKKLQAALEAYQHANHLWLGDHALFAALHRAHQHKSWPTWEKGLARRDKAALDVARKTHQHEVEREVLLQFLLHRQWTELREYAHSKGVRIVGDIPIFVAFDSADCWAAPHHFKLDAGMQRKVVAGVPPDYFSEDGQLWGNPLYDWAALAKDNYAWWVARVKAVAAQVDVIRIDHFRGFDAAWEIPAQDKTARNGKWVKGPGRAVFDAIHKALGPVPFIAEDLGIITPTVEALRDGLDLPGMRILQFAFGDVDGANLYLPHNHSANTVVYTGTHDNDTTRGWWDGLDQKTRGHVQMYLGRDGHDISWDLIRLAWMSVGHTAIAPLQDVLDLPTSARFNTPGKADGNWGWRVTEDALTPQVAQRLLGLTTLYARHKVHKESRPAGH